jgi:hypothetical protein
MALREGLGIVTGETCIKQLKKSSCAASHFLAVFCGWGCAKFQPTDYLT